MEELSFAETANVAGGTAPSWLFLAQVVADFVEGFKAGWRDGAHDVNNSGGGNDGWTMPNGESLPT